MKKKFAVLAMAVSMAVLVCACGNKTDNAAGTDAGQTTNDDAAATADTTADDTTDDTATQPESEGTFAFDAPDGFTLDEASNSYVSPNYPNEGSNINWSETPNDGSFDSISSDVLVASIADQYKTAYEVDVDITVSDEGFTTIGGYDAYYYVMEYEFNGIPIEQLQYIVDGTDNLYFVTYTNMNNEGYMDAFKASAQTIRFE